MMSKRPIMIHRRATKPAQMRSETQQGGAMQMYCAVRSVIS